MNCAPQHIGTSVVHVKIGRVEDIVMCHSPGPCPNRTVAGRDPICSCKLMPSKAGVSRSVVTVREGIVKRDNY